MHIPSGTLDSPTVYFWPSLPKGKEEKPASHLDVLQPASPASKSCLDEGEEVSFETASLPPLPSSHENSDEEETMEEGEGCFEDPVEEREGCFEEGVM